MSEGTAMNERQRTGAERISDERRRQVEVEGWTPEHDAGHDRLGADVHSDLWLAAYCYYGANQWRGGVPMHWPWETEAWKPTPDDRPRELEKAGALFRAEIDRLIAVGDWFNPDLSDAATKMRDCAKQIDESFDPLDLEAL